MEIAAELPDNNWRTQSYDRRGISEAITLVGKALCVTLLKTESHMLNLKPVIFTLFAASALAACQGAEAPVKENKSVAAEPAKRVITKDDKFTYANYDEVRVTHLDLNLDVNFDAKVLDGIATLDFERVKPGADMLVLDTKDLLIKSVRIFADGKPEGVTDYTMDEADKVLGEALRIPLTDKTDQVLISYRTSPKAEGLQWLSPEQTAGKKHPYLFSQAQALNARTMAPLQDTPAVRMTYSATLRVPDGLLPLMSASPVSYTHLTLPTKA